MTIVIVISLIFPNYALAQTKDKSPNSPQLIADAQRNGVPPAPPAVFLNQLI